MKLNIKNYTQQNFILLNIKFNFIMYQKFSLIQFYCIGKMILSKNLENLDIS